MRARGGSDAPPAFDAYTPFRAVGDRVGLIDHFGMSDCTIVGHDLGANVAWNAATMWPDRFRTVFGISVPFQRLGGPFDPVRGMLRPAPEAGKIGDDGFLAQAVESFAPTGFHGALNYDRRMDAFFRRVCGNDDDVVPAFPAATYAQCGAGRSS